MASPKQSCGAGPPAPPGIAAQQPEVMDHGEREGLVATGARRLRCKALLLLALCLAATALPSSLGSLAALPKALPASPPPCSPGLCSPGSQQGAADDLVTRDWHLPGEAEEQQRGEVLMGSGATSGSFPGPEGDVTHGTDAEGWSQGTPTPASPLTACTSAQWQPASRHGEGLRMGTAVAVTQWLGTRVSASSAQLLQTMGDPRPASQHPLALGSFHGTAASWHAAGQVSAVTLSAGLGQPAGMTEPHSPGAHLPPEASAHPGMLPKGQNTAEQPRDDQVLALGSPTGHQSMPCRANLSLAVSSKPPAVITASDLTSWASTAAASAQPTASGSSGVQHGAPGAGATTGSHNGQKKEVRPSPELGMSEDHSTALPLVPLPGLPSALPAEGTPNSTKRHPGTAWISSAATAELAWDMWPAASPLHAEAALLDTTSPISWDLGGDRLLAPAWTSAPSTTLAHDANHTQVLASFFPPAEALGPAVPLGMLTDLPAPPEAPTSSAWARASSSAGATVPGLSSAASDTIPEPAATRVPCLDGAAVVSPSSPGAAGVTHAFPLRSPPQRPPLHPDLFLPTASEHGATAGSQQPRKVAEMSVLPGQVAVTQAAGHSELRTASAAPTAAPAGPPEPSHASPGSVPPPSSQNPALEPCSEAVDPSNTTSLPSPSYLLLSPGALHAVSSPASSPTLAAPAAAGSVSSPSVTSQHSSTSTEHLPPAAGEASTPAELLSTASSPEVQPPAPQPPQVLPLQFQLVGITYTEALGSRASESYRQLEEEVKLMLNQMLSTYETFLQAEVLEFRNGSVVVRAEALFQGDAPAPTSSHLIRTLLTEASRGRSIFSWQLEPQSVQSGGFSLANLEPEKLSISLTVIQPGRDRTEALQRLSREVTLALSTLYDVSNFTIIQLRNLSGELEITGAIYLNTSAHADVAEVLQALTALASCSVDLSSLSVEGARLELQVYPVSFLITNRPFSEDLLDPLAVQHQELSRNLSDVVARTLRKDNRSFLQVVIRGFLPGSLICHGDVVFQHPAPTSLQVLEALVLAVGPNKALAGSDFQVDPYSLAVGEATLEPPQPQPGFPEYAVAIMVVCGLCIITAPIVVLVCLRSKRFRRWDREVLWDRRDAEAGTQTLEMDNQPSWASSEQSRMDAQTHWQNDSV